MKRPAVNELVKDPQKAYWLSHARRMECRGGCGRLVMGTICRKCVRRNGRKWEKEKRRAKRKSKA